MKYLLLLCSTLLAFPVSGEEGHPLLPADTSSPRATLNSFMESCETAYGMLASQGRTTGDEASWRKGRDAIRSVERCMDPGDVAQFRHENIIKEAAVALKEVLDRIELPDEKEIPDRKMMTRPDGSLIESWTIPSTEITLRLTKEGPMAGHYRFSPDTVARADEFYLRVKNLPYKEGATEGFAEIYLSAPGSKWLAEVVKRMPSTLRERKSGQAVWQWTGLGIVLFGTVLLMAVLYASGRRISKRGADGGMVRYILGLAFPIAAVFVPIKAAGIISRLLAISGTALYVVKFNLSLIALFASMIVVLGIGRRVGELIACVPHIKASNIDAQLARLMSRIMGMLCAIVLLLQGGQHLGIPLSSLLAGAGVVGAALALSAQDVLKNIFGSIMIILDKPYTVGERIKIKGYDGVVEEIGLRSTRIRLLNGHQAIIPNEDMARSDIENIGRRPFIRRVSTIRLPVDIGSAKARKAVEIVQGVLQNHEGFDPDFPPRAWLSEFESDHLDLKMIYWYHPPNYWDYTAHADTVNRGLLDAFEKAGIRIALPAFTTKIEDEAGVPVPAPKA
ncbi:Low conductance mechanosensitive channel YnaI [Pontiella desulfatans]|uniref:Low conductance mechanosensitive channel YnaI n=1 Tax=Pontiella desulfatans TaxID=2750659 RepID=A0A6C2UBR2_PONDE|nr:mechanosensitive ion channel family protein [Pontiella desulfatans]VGO17313.1 Low conductance mechanosensitive channel YnaI [Pontiella desulfatans]